LKLHTLVALQGSLPVWAAITEAAFPEMKMLSQIPVQQGAYYVMDRAYLDFSRLIRLHRGGAKFVVRNKRHVAYQVTHSSRVDKSTGLRCDQTISLTSPKTQRTFSSPLRRIRFRDPVEGRTLIFLTNDLDLPALTVCHLYKRRWEVELFFKWIKQHLRLRHFFGRSLNAIHCQIWTAICSYLLVAIARKELRTERSLYEILQIVSVSAFEQVPLREMVAKTSVKPINREMQMSLLFNGF
jgi:IS4 transposase